MAKVQGGLLGSFRGKVGGLVGLSWKGMQTVRGFVKPANPNTDGQKAQRGVFKQCSLLAISLLGPVLQPYMDPFIRGMSAFNWFIKKNISLFPSPIDYSKLILTEGQLFPAPITAIGAIVGMISPSTGTGLGSNGLDSDLKTTVALSDATGQVWTSETEVSRSSAGPSISSESLVAGLYHVWVITVRRDDRGIISKVGNSQYTSITVMA
jgi:hypothetical protein